MSAACACGIHSNLSEAQSKMSPKYEIRTSYSRIITIKNSITLFPNSSNLFNLSIQ